MALLPYLSQTINVIFNENLLNCEIYLAPNPHLSLVLLGIYFLIPLLLMICVYTQIFRAALKQTRKMSFNSVDAKIVKRKKAMKQNWKAIKIVFVVVGMFFLLWSPHFVVTAIKAYHPYILPYWIERFSLCCAYSNSCCNWVVYSVMNINIRSAYLKLLRIKNKNASRRNEFRMRSSKVGPASVNMVPAV